MVPDPPVLPTAAPVGLLAPIIIDTSPLFEFAVGCSPISDVQSAAELPFSANPAVPYTFPWEIVVVTPLRIRTIDEPAPETPALLLKSDIITSPACHKEPVGAR